MKTILTALGACTAGCVICVSAAEAQTETVLYSFCSQQNCPDGRNPAAGVIRVGGRLYGTTSGGGANGDSGTVFALDLRTDSETVRHSFGSGTDGLSPYAGLIRIDGTLYGTTLSGGRYYPEGTVFSLDPKTGAETVLYSFTGGSSDGNWPEAGLVNVQGMLYGTTQNGGSGRCPDNEGCGTVFSINPQTGAEAVVYSFQGNGQDGAYPRAGLIHVRHMLYGTTFTGGSGSCYNDGGCGTVFSLDLKTGAEAVVHYFCTQSNCADGAEPSAGLIDVDGILYGTTAIGGTGTCYGGCGTVFSIAPENNGETVLYSFQNNGADGTFPDAALIDVGGTLYGTTAGGGAYGGNGSVFSIDPQTGAETVLHSFQGYPSDGGVPAAGLFSDGGTLYGTTVDGGAYGDGTVFSITP
jgi:uncharacterized repeat protein (TIGR03803 family)